MNLTLEEFSIFNTKSKSKFLMKDGRLLKQRYLKDYLLVSLFSLYGFYIEAVLDVGDIKIISIHPVFNSDILNLYPP